MSRMHKSLGEPDQRNQEETQQASAPLLTHGEIKTLPWQLAKDHLDMGAEPLSRLWPWQPKVSDPLVSCLTYGDDSVYHME